MIIEGDELLMNPDYPRVAVRRRVVGGIQAVMNPSVADTKRDSLIHEATDEVNGIEYNVPILLVNPKRTSTTCPRCGGTLTYSHRLARCSKCGFVADRDTVGAVNIYLRVLRRMWGSVGSLLNAPAMKNEARQSGRTKDEPMTLYIKS